jgi:hypothetical protein
VVLAEAEGALQLGVRGFRALWRGERPLVSTLIDDPQVVAAQANAGRLEVDESGVLVGVHGLVTRTTRHRIEHEHGVVNTWCALDAIGIPAALGIDAVAVTSCPTCDRGLRIRIRDGQVVDGGMARLWLPGGACGHLVEDFCRHANLYCNLDHLEGLVGTDRPGRILDVTEVAVGMARTAVGTDDVDPPGSSGCWCCGDRTVQASLLRLTEHPEVGVCFRCVKELSRRKRQIERRTRPAPPGLSRWRRAQYRAGFGRC